jgi:hypothetical protein
LGSRKKKGLAVRQEFWDAINATASDAKTEYAVNGMVPLWVWASTPVPPAIDFTW